MRRIFGAIGVGLALLGACGKSFTTPQAVQGPEAGAGGASDAGSAGSAPVGAQGGEAASGAPALGGADAGESAGGTPGAGEGGAGGAPIDDWNVAGDDAGGAPSAGPVTGKIELQLRPAPGAIVRIDGDSKLTEEDGSFTFDDVAAEYDLTVIYEPGREAKVIEGLTTRQPVVVLGNAEANRSAVVAGKLSGGAGFPLPAGHDASVAVVFPATVVGFGQKARLADQATSYLLQNVDWLGPQSIEGELVALQWQNGFTGPRAFTGFARKPLTLTGGVAIGDANGSVEATNLALDTQPAVSSYDGTLSSADPYDDFIPLLEVGPFAFGFANGVGSFSVLTPEIDLPTGIDVLAVRDVSDQMYIYVPKPAPGEKWRVSVPKLPSLVVPQAAAKVTVATAFEWESMPKHAVAHSSWFIDDWNIERVTRSTSTTIPDLTADGVPKIFPAVTWFLDAIGPADKPEQSLALQARLLRRQPVRHFNTYVVRVVELVE